MHFHYNMIHIIFRFILFKTVSYYIGYTSGLFKRGITKIVPSAANVSLFSSRGKVKLRFPYKCKARLKLTSFITSRIVLRT